MADSLPDPDVHKHNHLQPGMFAFSGPGPTLGALPALLSVLARHLLSRLYSNVWTFLLCRSEIMVARAALD
ncbi:hypothetical protein PG993_006463 [Apiospora rasikravindrae]|uniref:Uncharacterized protein n=1 Tax=Apiospora rasikravindrae TaxID=990691 RepID=A0ABR1T5S1_9PEZI